MFHQSPFGAFLFFTFYFKIFILSSSSLQGAKAVAEMLKKNASLCTLELNNNMIDYSVSH